MSNTETHAVTGRAVRRRAGRPGRAGEHPGRTSARVEHPSPSRSDGGVIELTLIAVLKGFGVPAGVAAAGVLSWRLVNFWLPIPFGGVSYLSLRVGRARLAAGVRSHPSTGRGAFTS